MSVLYGDKIIGYISMIVVFSIIMVSTFPMLIHAVVSTDKVMEKNNEMLKYIESIQVNSTDPVESLNKTKDAICDMINSYQELVNNITKNREPYNTSLCDMLENGTEP